MKSGCINAPISHTDKPLILGVDPGLSGAYALIDRFTGGLAYVSRLPVFKTATKARKSGFMRHLDINQWAKDVALHAADIYFGVVEDPGAMPNQGLGSTFRFGLNCGQIQGILAANFIPAVMVKPAAWKGYMGLNQDKKESLALAAKHYNVKLKASEADLAEAMLLARYGYLFVKK